MAIIHGGCERAIELWPFRRRFASGTRPGMGEGYALLPVKLPKLMRFSYAADFCSVNILTVAACIPYQLLVDT